MEGLKPRSRLKIAVELQEDSPSIRDLTNSRFAEIFLHQSAGCISQEASDQLKLEVLTSLRDTPGISKRFLNFSLHRLVC